MRVKLPSGGTNDKDLSRVHRGSLLKMALNVKALLQSR